MFPRLLLTEELGSRLGAKRLSSRCYLFLQGGWKSISYVSLNKKSRFECQNLNSGLYKSLRFSQITSVGGCKFPRHRSDTIAILPLESNQTYKPRVLRPQYCLTLPLYPLPTLAAAP